MIVDALILVVWLGGQRREREREREMGEEFPGDGFEDVRGVMFIDFLLIVRWSTHKHPQTPVKQHVYLYFFLEEADLGAVHGPLRRPSSLACCSPLPVDRGTKKTTQNSKSPGNPKAPGGRSRAGPVEQSGLS